MNKIKSKSCLFLALALGLVGCGVFSEKKFETGGAYAASPTQAAQPELYVADASFDLAFTSLDTAFKYERANRAALWAVSPKIKHRMDGLRTEASQVWLDYATARQAYVFSPTANTSNQLQILIGKLQQANAAALAVILKKGE